MLEGSLPPPGVELLVGLHEDLLDDVLHLPFEPSMTAGRGEHPRLMSADQVLEPLNPSPPNQGDNLGIGLRAPPGYRPPLGERGILRPGGISSTRG